MVTGRMGVELNDEISPEPREQIRRNLARINPLGLDVPITAGPLRVVLRRHGPIRVPELLGNVSRVNSPSQQLRCERVPKILRSHFTEPGPLEDPKPFVLAKTGARGPFKYPLVGLRIRPLPPVVKQCASKSLRNLDPARPSALGWR